MSEIASKPKQISFEEWVAKYKPIANRSRKDANYDGFEFEVRGNDFILVQKADPKYVWTMLESDGLQTIVAGIHYVNREAYFITEEPYQTADTEEAPDVIYWGHDDELEFLLDNFSDLYDVKYSDTEGIVTISQAGEEDDITAKVSDTNDINFEIGQFSFQGHFSVKGDVIILNGVDQEGKATKTVRIQI